MEIDEGLGGNWSKKGENLVKPVVWILLSITLLEK